MSELNTSESLAHSLARYRNHLEFNGYHVEEDEELLFCRHPRKHNLMLRHIDGRGVLIRTIYSSETNIKRINLLEYVNELNSEFLFMKAYIYGEENDLYLETFSEGEYDRTNFSIMLENIEYDMDVLVHHQLTKDYLQ